MLYAIIWFMSKAELPTPEQIPNTEPLPEKTVRSIGDTAMRASGGEADQSGQTLPMEYRSFTKPVETGGIPPLDLRKAPSTGYTLVRDKAVAKQRQG